MEHIKTKLMVLRMIDGKETVSTDEDSGLSDICYINPSFFGDGYAEDIVTAVNAYDKDQETINRLVKSLNVLVAAWDNGMFAVGVEDETSARGYFNVARQAIAKAEGK